MPKIGSFAQPQIIIGIDEAGRGPLAGPIVVAGIAHHYGKRPAFLDRVKDSKKLSPKRREEWFSRLISHPEISWAVVRVWPKVIDKINIYRAANLGARRVYQKLSRGRHATAVLDGSLYLSRNVSYDTVIKGDEKLPAVAAASIIAKVTRDRIMRRLHKKYPRYRFDVHKGYPTLMHRKLVKKFGVSAVHRQSFRFA